MYFAWMNGSFSLWLLLEEFQISPGRRSRQSSSRLVMKTNINNPDKSCLKVFIFKYPEVKTGELLM